MIKHSGSSPHARGTQVPSQLISHRRGIIPACAGNTVVTCRTCTLPWDHPRMRGEHQVVAYQLMMLLGSSPHARGTLT